MRVPLKERLANLYADADFGLEAKQAGASCYSLSKRHDLAPATVWKHLTDNDIKMFGEPISGKFFGQSARRRAEVMIAENQALLESWAR